MDSRLFVWDGSDDMRCVTVVLGQIRVQVNAYCPQIGDLFKEYEPIPYAGSHFTWVPLPFDTFK